MSVNAEYSLFNAVLKRLKNLAASWITSGVFSVDRIPVHGANKHTDVTREVFLSVAGGYISAGTASFLSKYASATGEVNVDEPRVFFTIKVPDDFVSFSSVKAVWHSAGLAGNAYWRLQASYAADGELREQHTDLPAAGTTAYPGGDVIVVQEPANALTLTNLAKGDHLGVEFYRFGSDAADTLTDIFNLIGLLFTYTAEQ